MWCDAYELRQTDRRVLAAYTGGPLDGLAAVVECPIGKGRVILLGTQPDDAWLKKLIRRLSPRAEIVSDPGVVMVERVTAEGKPAGAIMINTRNEAATYRRGSSAKKTMAGYAVETVKFLGGTAPAASFNWQSADTSLALRYGDKTVWQLVVDPKQQKTYFHPLATVNGEVLTALHPADHPWHCGLWWSWKYINGLNYWDWDWDKGNNGKTEGVNELTGKKVTTNRDFSAQVVLKFSYHPTDMPPVLTETRTLSISSPDKNGNYRIDWTSIFIAADKPVKLDRTPPSKTDGRLCRALAAISEGAGRLAVSDQRKRHHRRARQRQESGVGRLLRPRRRDRGLRSSRELAASFCLVSQRGFTLLQPRGVV